jgi:predicted amidohydrolase YtcJ
MKYLLFPTVSLLLLAHANYSQTADLILQNGNFVTLKSRGDRARAVAIKEDKVLYAGSMENMKQFLGKNTRVIDLENKTVLPGFNDVHQHPAPLYSWDKPYSIIRLDTVSSMESLVELLHRKAAITPKGMLIQGRGYNEIRLRGQPTRQTLDKASVDHPIIITHASGHLSAVNSFVLQKYGINKHTQDPPGGSLERDSDGEPDGIIKESARSLLSAKKMTRPPGPTWEEELEGYRKYFEELLSSGITSVGDCWTTPDKIKIYRALVDSNFPMRFNLYVGVDYLDQLLTGEIHREQSAYLRINGVKIFHGNSLSGKTCWLYDPYDTINPVTGKKDYYGISPARNQSSLDSLVLKIHRAGLQIACHSNGDREIDMVINAIEHAQKKYYVADIRHRIEHCSITNQSILDRIKRDSIVPVFHCYINELGDQLLAYGSSRWPMLIPTESALDMGIPFALHSDYPVSRYEAMTRLGSAVNRTTRSGFVISPNQRLQVEDAIKAYTVGGAYTTHEENLKGSIVAGQYADMIVLDSDPTRIDPSGIESIHVVMTIVGGRIAYEKK